MIGLPMMAPHSPASEILNAVTMLVDMTYTAFLVSRIVVQEHGHPMRALICNTLIQAFAPQSSTSLRLNAP